MKKMLKIHPVYLVGISLLIAFCLHLGCQEDTTSAPIPDDPDEILMHWAATQDQTWSILLMEKVAKYEAENYRALAYARDLEILIFAKFYYQTKLAEIYGDNCVDDTIFLKQKWEGLVTKVVNKEIPLLDYNKEWNSYRLLFYTTPPEKRGHINTRSDDFTIWGCNFASIIYKGLSTKPHQI